MSSTWESSLDYPLKPKCPPNGAGASGTAFGLLQAYRRFTAPALAPCRCSAPCPQCRHCRSSPARSPSSALATGQCSTRQAPDRPEPSCSCPGSAWPRSRRSPFPPLTYLPRQPDQVPQPMQGFALLALGLAGSGVIANLSRVMFAIGRLKIAATAIAGSWLLVIVADVVLAEIAPARLVVAALALGCTTGQTLVAIPLGDSYPPDLWQGSRTGSWLCGACWAGRGHCGRCRWRGREHCGTHEPQAGGRWRGCAGSRLRRHRVWRCRLPPGRR
jgi:hypothetical protein